MFTKTLFLQSWNVEKYSRAGEATDYNIRIHITSWVPEATNTHS